MRKFLFLSLFVVDLFVLDLHAAEMYAGLSQVPASYTEKSNLVEVSNMPAVRSQDSLQICYAFTTATILDASLCKEKNIDCKTLAANKRASVLDLARFGRDVRETKPDSDPTDYFAYEGIEEGGTAALALSNAKLTNTFTSEACAPFDQVVNKSASYEDNKALLEASWKRLKALYDEYKKKASKCSDCGPQFADTALTDIKKDFNLKVSDPDAIKAFGQATYEKFLISS